MRKLILGTEIGFDLTTEQEIRSIKRAGWDGVFTEWNEQKGIGDYARLAKQEGLYYHSVHAPFGRVDRLWESGEDGDAELALQIRCLEDCAENGIELVVLHTIIGMEKCTPTPLGVERYGRIFDRAHTLGITVALENTEGEIYLDTLLQTYAQHKAVGFCIDTGHEMCYNYGHDLITKYKHKLVCTHLNDNMGITGDAITWMDDAHMLPFDGKADWAGIADRLRAADYDGPLTFELLIQNKPERHTHDRYKGLDPDAFVALALERAKRFRAMLDNI